MFGLDRGLGQGGQEAELWIGVVETHRVHEKPYGVPQIVGGLFGESSNQRNRSPDLVPVGSLDSGDSLGQIEAFVEDLLHSGRSALNSEEDAAAAGPGHKCDQFVVHAVGAGAAAPVEFLTATQKSVAKCDYSLAIHGEHIVDQ